jgi:predicted signal transduction protein with EAL and GGDEF domain
MRRREPAHALIADDDVVSLMLLQATAETIGLEVTAVASGEEALEAMQRHNYALILLDVEMARIDGYEVCRRMRRLPKTAHLPIVMITSHDSPSAIEQAFEAGATDFIPKPLNWTLVAHRLRYILRNAAAEQRVRSLATTDAMTGLPNRMAFNEATAHLLAMHSDAGADTEIGVVAVGVGSCARIEETLGPASGDAAVRGFVEVLLSCVRRLEGPAVACSVARLNSTRFVVGYKAPSTQNIGRALCERIAQAFVDAVPCGQHRFFLRPALGIARFPAHGDDAEALLMHAETAQQAAASSCQVEACVYSPELTSRSLERMELDAALRMAVREDRLALEFQPIYRVSDGELSSLEALIRWTDPARGDVAPQDFMPVAESSELIVEIGRSVIRGACRALRQWHDAGLETSVAINVSAKQFLYDRPAREILAAAREADIDPRRLVVEITESMLMTDLVAVRDGLAAVRQIGCRVAVDDFGTGCSSLAYLQELPIDELKIDRLFLRHVGSSDRGGAAIFEAVVRLARSLGLAVTAEGIETAAQLGWIRARGVDRAQGFLLSRPLSSAQVLATFAPAPAAAGSRVA